MSIQEIEKLREVASLRSKGDSSNIIHHTLFQLSRNYHPARITPISSYDLKPMIGETNTFRLQSLQYFNNGRIPGE